MSEDVDFFIISAYIGYSKQRFELHAIMKNSLKKEVLKWNTIRKLIRKGWSVLVFWS
jgi:hypothetical protein